MMCSSFTEHVHHARKRGISACSHIKRLPRARRHRRGSPHDLFEQQCALSCRRCRPLDAHASTFAAHLDADRALGRISRYRQRNEAVRTFRAHDRNRPLYRDRCPAGSGLCHPASQQARVHTPSQRHRGNRYAPLLARPNCLGLEQLAVVSPPPSAGGNHSVSGHVYTSALSKDASLHHTHQVSLLYQCVS
jgi:hypothetical protein